MSVYNYEARIKGYCRIEPAYTKSGKAVIFKLPMDYPMKDDKGNIVEEKNAEGYIIKNAKWATCICFGKLMEEALERVKKGYLCDVMGHFEPYHYIDKKGEEKDGIILKVLSIISAFPPKQKDTEQQKQYKQQQAIGIDMPDDDIPF